VKENKALIRRLFEEVPHNPDACDEICAPRVRFHSIHQTTINTDLVDSSPEMEKGFYERVGTVWGDRRRTIDEMIAEGDRVLVRWTLQGTHRGEYLGLPPTNRRVTYSGVNIFRIAEGKIAECWGIHDRLWLWQQLGALPETTEFIARAREEILSQQRLQVQS
jgi:hypothetical protein